VTLDELTAAALAAAVTVARDQGLADGDPRIQSARGNLLVHLAPDPVVARVATLTAFSRQDPFAWLRREVEVAGSVAPAPGSRGGGVVALHGPPVPGPLPGRGR
jgi:hypothetical protein